MISRFLTKLVFGNLGVAVVDNFIRDKVIPKPGSVVYCKLGIMVEHSGIYIGNDEIIHLDGSGKIEKISASGFIRRIGGFNPSAAIYVSCKDTTPVYRQNAVRRALDLLGGSREYNIIMDNCHQFTVGCITGEPCNPSNFFYFLEATLETELGHNNWRVWER